MPINFKTNSLTFYLHLSGIKIENFNSEVESEQEKSPNIEQTKSKKTTPNVAVENEENSEMEIESVEPIVDTSHLVFGNS